MMFVKRHFYNVRLQKDKPKLPRQQRWFKFDSATYVGILFSVSDLDWESQIRAFTAFLGTKQIRYAVMGYAKRPVPDVNISYCQFFNNKQISWLDTPKRNTPLFDFMREPFDMLINCCSADYRFMHYVTLLSPASFRIGTKHQGKDLPYDLMLSLPDRKNAIAPFFDVLNEYLPLFCHQKEEEEQNDFFFIS